MSSTDPARAIFGPAPRPLHLGISVANLEQSITWYGDKLGFRLTRRLDLPEGKLRVAILEYGGFGVELIEVAGSQPYALAWQEPGAQHAIRGIVHFAFKVDDLDGTAAALRAQGVRFACDLTTLEGLGIRYFHIFDIDGNLLEFGETLV